MSFPDNIRFAHGKTLAGVRTVERSWGSIVRALTKGHRAYPDKVASTACPNILGGPTDDRGKEHTNVLGRSLITLDYDDLGPDFEVEDMAFTLDMLGYAAVCYSTFSHMTERADGCARLRVIVPLEREVSRDAYPALARSLADEIGIEGIGKESFVSAQIMFLPSCMEGYEQQAWTHVVDGEPFPVEAVGAEVEAVGGSVGGSVGGGVGDDDDLLLDIAYEPMDVLDAEVDKALEMFPAEGLDYDDWMMVGMGLWHQYRGSLDDDGFGRWLAWSRKSSKHDGRQMRKKWRSCGGRSTPITMASVFARVGGLGAVREALDEDGSGSEFVAVGDQVEDDEAKDDEAKGGEVARSGVLSLLDKLSEAAQGIEDVADYERLKSQIVRIPERHLGADYRGMVAAEVYSAWGKGAGLSKAKIEKALQPEKPKAKSPAGGEPVSDGDKAVAVSEADCWNPEYPKWIQGWVFDETEREFVNVRNGHAIKREAFSMKYDRMPECAEHEMDALGLSSKVFPIPTVAARMYWPGNGRVFSSEDEGMTYLNTWRWSGGASVKVPESGEFEVGDDSLEGQACQVFLDHLERTVEDPRERRLMLDWMAWVYSKPGSRVRWALLLWGVEGNGKSYFHTVLSRLMGRNARSVAASTIEERFTDWGEGSQLVGIEEIRVSGTNKWRTLDKMKPFISNDTVEVEGKGVKAKSIPNFTSYMLFTNHVDAIPVGDGDRRYFVVFSRQRTKSQLIEEHGGVEGTGAYFQRLFDVSLAGIGGIGRMLLDHEYSDEFDPNGRAPHSAGREEMMAMHISEEDDALADALEKYHGPCINEKLIDLTKLYVECEFDSEIELPKTRTMSHKLVEMGYKKGGRVKVKGRNHTFWFRPDKVSFEEAKRIITKSG